MNLKSTLGLAAATATAAVGVVGLGLSGTASASPVAPRVITPPATCSIQTFNTGNFVTAVGGGGRTTDVIHTDATRVGSWERFTFVASGDGRLGIRTVTGNYGTAATRGLDLSAEYRFNTQHLGRFTARAAGSTVYHEVIRTRPDLAAVETVDTYEVPRVRGNASLAWAYQKFGAAVTGDYIHGFADAAPSVVRVKQQTIVGLQLSYELPYATRVTLGANNLFDRDPPRTAASTGYAEQTSYFLPRFLYVDVTKKF